MDVELDPPQPEEVVQAVAEALSGPDRSPDPWWQVGIEESLDT
jgi:hypothetical protein